MGLFRLLWRVWNERHDEEHCFLASGNTETLDTCTYQEHNQSDYTDSLFSVLPYACPRSVHRQR